MNRQVVVERCRTLMNELLEKSGVAMPAFPAQDRYGEENLRAQCGAMMRVEGLDQALGPHLVELCRLFSELGEERKLDQFVLHLSHVAVFAGALHEGQSREAWERMMRTGATRCTACRHRERCLNLANCRFCHHPDARDGEASLKSSRARTRRHPPSAPAGRPSLPVYSSTFEPQFSPDTPEHPHNAQYSPVSHPHNAQYSPESPRPQDDIHLPQDDIHLPRSEFRYWDEHEFPNGNIPQYSPVADSSATLLSACEAHRRFEVHGPEVPRAAENAPLCHVCFETKATTAISCGHQGFCLDCVKKMERCPLCRQGIKYAINLWPLTVTREEQD